MLMMLMMIDEKDLSGLLMGDDGLEVEVEEEEEG